MNVRAATIEDCEALGRGMKVVVDEGRWLATEPGVTAARAGGALRRRLLVEAALAARPPAVHKIELEAFPENEAAIALYQEMGFKREGVRRRHLRRRDGSLRDCPIMARLFQ